MRFATSYVNVVNVKFSPVLANSSKTVHSASVPVLYSIDKNSAPVAEKLLNSQSNETVTSVKSPNGIVGA